METATDLDHVLRGISGPDLYRNNIFRVTGLPAEATAGQIRRRREEAILESRLNPESDADTIRGAFETLRDPVARLTHELLWFSAPEQHREAVEAESRGPFAAESVEAKRLDRLWVNSLAAWALRLEAPEFWAHAKERVSQIDDPRLTTGTVRRLREQLPRHIASVTAGLAVRAASLDVEAADRLSVLLDESPFPDDVVDDVLREAVRPAEREIRAACSTTRDALQAKEDQAESLADDLLAKVGRPMRVIEALQGKEADVTVALSDEIALLVNNCAIGHNRVTGTVSTALRLLELAKPMARIRGTIELIGENISVIGLNDLTTEMRELCDRGKVGSADRRRRALLAVLPDGDLKDALQSIPPDDKRVGGDVHRVPQPFNIFGMGTRYVTLPRRDEPFQSTTVLMMTIFFIPLIPVSAYLTSYPRFRARIPLGRSARWWRFIVLNFLLGMLGIGIFVGPPAENLTVLLTVYAISLLFVGIRWLWLRTWALGKVGR
ncbi:MAG: hypothetical protein ABW224_25335 [Kibdelosporangium sp.]